METVPYYGCEAWKERINYLQRKWIISEEEQNYQE
jgi:hypothetical protein